jgi:RNA polymerase sigma factor (sigma-70 family)
MAFKAKKSKAVEGSNPASWSVAQFSSFYTLNRSELIAHANRIVKDKAKAEEIIQEALVKFMLATPELSSDSHALSYLHRTIENLCIDLFRAENRRPNLVALDDATAEVESTWQVSGDHSLAISAAEDAAIIRQALSLLSPAERAALVMWEVEGRSTAEIAKELGIKESAVRHTVSRARASLRKVLSELVIDEARGLTALDLLSTTYKKAAEIAGKSSKIALTFVLVLTAFLGLNSLTGNEPNTSLITTSSSQVNSNQDMPPVSESPLVVEQPVINSGEAVKPVSAKNSISAQEYADHMQLSLNQLETVTLMLQVLEQTGGGPAPTE